MKRCPECRRDYYDDTLLYCLDDGNALLEGPASGSGSIVEPATAILSEPPAPLLPEEGWPKAGVVGVAAGQLSSESSTRVFDHTTDQTAILKTGAEAEPQGNLGESSERQSLVPNREAKPLVIVAVAAVLLIAGFFGY